MLFFSTGTFILFFASISRILSASTEKQTASMEEITGTANKLEILAEQLINSLNSDE